MIVRHLSEALETDRHVVDPHGNWTSTRLLLRDDNMGFSFHITTIFAGADFDMHYQNHLESVYCISGEGQITERDSGTTHLIQPGTVYALDQNDRHTLKAVTEMQLACVFNPPITGKEVHNAEGAYELVE